MASGARIIGGRGAFARSPLARQASFASALALTRTAQDMRDETRKMLAQRLDNPSRWTLNSVTITPATKASLRAEVYFLEHADKGVAAGTYLRHMETGGVRAAKRFERALLSAGVLREGQRAIPADGGSLDGKRGNVGGRYTRLLSALRASSDPFQNASLRNINRTKAGRRKRTAYTAWVQRDDAGDAVAIWERGTFSEARRDGTKVRRQSGRPVLIIVNRTSYGPTLGFQARAALTFKARWPVRMAESWSRALATSR